jgi:outer membrane protein TolC
MQLVSRVTQAPGDRAGPGACRVAGRSGTALASTAAILVGSACAHYRPAPLTPEAGAAALEARTLDDPGLRDFVRTNLGRELPARPPAEWDLEALTLVAFYYHPGLDVARAAWSVARAEVVTAGGRAIPEAGAEAGHVIDTDDPSRRILGLSLVVPVETAGKRGHRIAAARARSEAARLAVRDAAWTVRQRVREGLLDLWDAKGRVTRGRRREEIGADIVRMLERRLEVGQTSRPEVTRERLALGRAQLAARVAERDRERARAALAAALALPAEALAGAAFSFSSFEAAQPERLAAPAMRRRALLGRADVLGLLSEYAASDAALRLEVARQYPDLRLAPGYTFEQGESHFTLGLALPVTLGRNRGKVAEAEARRRESATRFLALQARVLGETDLASAAAEASGRAVETARDVLARLNESRGAAAASFAAGTADRLDLRAAELELAEAEDALFRTLVEHQRARGRLEGAIQGVLSEPGADLPSTESPPRSSEAWRP